MSEYTYTIVRESERENHVTVLYARGIDREDNVVLRVGIPPGEWNDEKIKKEIILNAQTAIAMWADLDAFEPSGNVDLSTRIDVPQTFTTDPLPFVDQENEDLVQTLVEAEDGTQTLQLTTEPKALEHKINNHKEKAAADRWGYEQLGVRWTKSDGTEFVFMMGELDQARWSNARVAANAGLREPTSSWKAIDAQTGNVTWIQLSNEEVIEISNLIFRQVQMCFDAEAAVNAKIDAHDFSSSFVQEYMTLAGITEEDLTPANTTLDATE